MKRKWKIISFAECPVCGNNIQVFSDNNREDWVCDGDNARCVDSGCTQEGYANCDGEGGAIIVFI